MTTSNGEIPSSFRQAVKKEAVMLSSDNSYVWHPICELFTFTQVSDQCVMALDGYSESWEHGLE